MKAVLNVGGGSKLIPLPPHFDGWQHDLLDIDPAGHPDVCMDARLLLSLPPATYDAIHCSHNLEHYHRHDGARVIRGFAHVLRDEGFAEIFVPDIEAVMRDVVTRGMDIDDPLYVSPSGPILVRDVFYGYHVQIERSGNDFYAHKTAFTVKSLVRFMAENGFPIAAAGACTGYQLGGFFFKQNPGADLCRLLGIGTSGG